MGMLPSCGHERKVPVLLSVKTDFGKDCLSRTKDCRNVGKIACEELRRVVALPMVPKRVSSTIIFDREFKGCDTQRTLKRNVRSHQ